MAIDDSLAKGLKKQVANLQKKTMFKHMDFLEQDIFESKIKSRQGYIKYAKKMFEQLWGDAIFSKEIAGKGKTFFAKYYSLCLTDQSDESEDGISSIYLSLINGRAYDSDTIELPVFLSNHGISRMIQTIKSDDINRLGALIKDHVFALIDLKIGQDHAGENLTLYCQNGVSIWAIDKLNETVVLPYLDLHYTTKATLKSFIGQDVLEPQHVQYANQRADKLYYHRYTP